MSIRIPEAWADAFEHAHGAPKDETNKEKQPLVPKEPESRP
jgi:hypothetical protein